MVREQELVRNGRYEWQTVDGRFLIIRTGVKEYTIRDLEYKDTTTRSNMESAIRYITLRGEEVRMDL